MEAEEVLGIVAGIFTSASMLPQLIKLVKEKKAEDLSLSMFICLIVGVSLWIWYGVLKKDLPIIITNAFSVFINLIVLFLSLKYSSKKESIKEMLA